MTKPNNSGVIKPPAEGLHPAQSPLTQTPAPDMDWSRPQSPASNSFDDIYFSVENGLAETRAVFLEACGLPERWASLSAGEVFVIGELGFGTGLNALATWQMWRACHPESDQARPDQARPDHGKAVPHLHFVSIEKYPLSQEQLRRALENWPQLSSLSKRLIEAWPDRVKGVHRLHLARDITLTLYHEDVETALGDMTFKADAWFLDGFSPAKNPDMWAPSLMARLATLSKPGARIGTFTAAGFVREGLREAGFDVEKVKGFGRKRHRLDARLPVSDVDHAIHKAADKITPIIIGAGIGGASLAHAFLRRGITPVVIDPGDDTAASRNPAALVTPRLDLNMQPGAKFYLAAYLYALRLYETHGTVLSRGIDMAAMSEREEIRYARLAANAALPLRHMKAYENGPFGTQGIRFPQALSIEPKATLETLLAGAKRIKARAYEVTQGASGVTVLNEDGGLIASGTHIITAAGANIADIKGFSGLPLRYRRGQLTWVGAAPEFTDILTYGGYALPLDGEILLGATHEALDDQDASLVRPQDDEKNKASFEAVSNWQLRSSARSSRSSVRVNSHTTQPCIFKRDDFETGPRTYILTALGSRGFTFAPLLAEDIVSKICGQPDVLPPGLFSQKIEARSLDV